MKETITLLVVLLVLSLCAALMVGGTDTDTALPSQPFFYIHESVAAPIITITEDAEGNTHIVITPEGRKWIQQGMPRCDDHPCKEM